MQNADSQRTPDRRGLYGISALYCAAFAAWIFHWMVTTGGWGFLILPFIELLPPCFLFVLVTYGSLRARGWARTLGLVVSVGAIAIMSCMLLPISGVVRYMLGHPESYLMGAFLLSSLTLLPTNALCLYYLTRAPVKQYLREERGRST